MGKKAWQGIFTTPNPGRSMKPRTNGLTMVLDKGLGRRATNDLMDIAADYIDSLKLTFGTSAFYDVEVLREKIEIVTGAGVDIYPGGTFLEVAVWQDRYVEYLNRAKELGFTAIEVSDGTLEMTDAQRADCIKRALDAGFKVISEVGKKSPDEAVATAEMHRLVAHDLELGVSVVIVEAREGGTGIGIFDKTGAVEVGELDAIVAGLDDLDKVMWEAPLKNQQQYLILRFGPNVNLGNVPTVDILALEALRQGLRGDTLKRAIARGL
ncbi:MAG: phosphosulfolactate synthase [Anaerolineales bacterium]|jgi:phosphosulfolactate synthase